MTENSNRMAFSRRKSSSKLVRKVSPSCSKKENKTFHRLSSRGCGEMGPLRLHGKKATAVFPKLVEDYDGFDKQFESEPWSGEDKRLWLSSDCVCDLDSWKLSLNEWFLGKGIPFFDGSRINPIEEAVLVLDRTSEGIERILQEDFQEELEVVTWLLSSAEESLCEDSSVLDSSWTSPSINHDSSSEMWDFDRMSVWASLLDLNEEDSKWVSDKESELDVCDFHSPSDKMKCSTSDAQSSGSSVSSLTEEKFEDLLYDLSPRQLSEAAYSDHEPLFWPYERKFDWSAEIMWDWFCMSPRKNGEDDGIPKGLWAPNFVRLRLHDHRKRDLNEGCRRRLVFSSISSNKGIKRISTMPSRLSKSTDIRMETTLEKKNNLEKSSNSKVLTETLVGDYREFLEKSFSSNEDVAIETLLGLDEFDGHEGVDAGFNESNFSLDDSL